MPGRENCSANASWMRRRSPFIIGARRRRTPRPYSCMSALGAKTSMTSPRCSSVRRLRSSSSWLRRNVAHCACSGSRTSVVSASIRGSASARARASQILGFSTKSKSICARSFGPSGRPAVYFTTSVRSTLASQSRVESPLLPLGVLPPFVEDGVVHRAGVDARRHLFQDERCRVDPEPRRTELQPEGHDLGDLAAYVGVGPVQVGLEVVEAVEVPRLRLLVEGPGLGLLAGEHRALEAVRRLVGRPDVPVAVRASRGRRRPSGTTGARRRCG